MWCFNVIQWFSSDLGCSTGEVGENDKHGKKMHRQSSICVLSLKYSCFKYKYSATEGLPLLFLKVYLISINV